MPRIVITGGAGFIGSHVAERIAAEYPDASLTILDKMTYAADRRNLVDVLTHPHRQLVIGDLVDFDVCVDITRNADVVIHLAAESHVDNSFGNSLRFTLSNTLGTHTLLEACRLNKVSRLIHVSTDEVYGETHAGVHVETDALNPTNPYSASKAGADMIVNGYIHSFRMPVVVVRANNIFGTRQYPEKIIPRFCMLGLSGQKFTLHGNGQNRRRFLAVEDFADAIVVLLGKGRDGEIYNVGSEDEFSNTEIRDMIASHLGLDGHGNTVYVDDRPFNDFRYAINFDKLHKLGWQPRRRLADELGRVIDWYRVNAARYADLFARVGE